MPEWFLDEPCVERGDTFYLQAFYDLSTCRTSGFGVSAIPWRDIIAYADWRQLDDDVTHVFVRVIRAMDKAFLEWKDAESARNAAMKHLLHKSETQHA